MKPAIDIQQLGKDYRISAAQAYLSLRENFGQSLRNLVPGTNRKKELFTALNDINLTIQPGERVGIIGRNGAGKSTLLKILSRITPPTRGNILLQGRVGSLLEVGTGFHPELTGRENIYLNGSILGLKKAEIKKQEDAIIAFSGVEKFIDSPLKHFSSGMQLRLAFAVAAHLEPEILLIDEVLAVGDHAFQQKCIGKMEEISRNQGRTILFVTHNLDTLRRFCLRAVLLNEGSIVSDGPSQQVINDYMSGQLQVRAESRWNPPVNSPGNEVRLHRAWIHNQNNQLTGEFDTTEPVGISIEYEQLTDSVRFTHGINVFNQENINIFNVHDTQTALQPARKPGLYQATVWIPGNLLPEGRFSISVALFVPNPVDILVHEKQVLQFELYTDFGKQTARGNYAADFPGIIRPLLNWELQAKTEN